MVKRTGRDQREGEEDTDTAERFRVDRVFVPSRSSSPALPGVAPAPAPARARAPSTMPPSTMPMSEDTEVSLRRQLSKLQHQLADAQRELAGKGDELAAEIEHRLLISAAREKLLA